MITLRLLASLVASLLHISFHPFNHHNYIYVILFKVLLILRSTWGFQIIICSISLLKFVFATKKHSATNLLNHTVSKHHYVMHLNCTILKTHKNNFNVCACLEDFFDLKTLKTKTECKNATH